MRKKILKILCLCSCFISASSFSDEKCDPYTFPGKCVGQHVSVLDGLDFEPDPAPNAHYDVISTSPHSNPIGLHVMAYIKNERICVIRYSRSTAVHSINHNDFDRIKDEIVSYYKNSAWVERSDGSSYGYLKTYNDGEIRINITRHHVNFTDLSGCGGQDNPCPREN